MSQKKNSFLHNLRKKSRQEKPEIELSGRASCLNDSQDEDWLYIVDDKAETSAVESATRPLRKPRAATKTRAGKAPPARVKRCRNGKPFLANSLQGGEVAHPTNLYQCRSQADIASLRSYQAKTFQEKALKPLKPKTRKAALGDRYESCMRAISGEATSYPTMASPKVLTDAYEHAGRGLIAMCNTNPSLQVVFATVVSGDGVTSSDVTVIDVEHEISKAKKFAGKVTPNFFGVVEIALFNSHKHDAGGRIIQVHSHMLLVGENILEKAEAAAMACGATLSANFTNAPQIVVEPVETDELNLMKMASYLFKLPYQAKTWCPPREGKRGHMQHSTKTDRGSNYLRLAMILSMMRLENVIFAGGACKAIRSGLISDVRSNCKSASVNPDRMLAPDTIGALWVEVSKALNKPKWQLPVIITSK